MERRRALETEGEGDTEIFPRSVCTYSERNFLHRNGHDRNTVRT